ncbi:hypothetical protein DRE_01306 [Drechslerella stenobrocha 248]|uniref:Uncharacterized protein n=1 Tax=Drechslerella stenobrocha 248 TaxID=1043628 RepID=W7HLL5_9PEZI|nr:hypothetical protein DRE_01306 [Drechslerella stenobrocha 248]
MLKLYKSLSKADSTDQTGSQPDEHLNSKDPELPVEQNPNGHPELPKEMMPSDTQSSGCQDGSASEDGGPSVSRQCTCQTPCTFTSDPSQASDDEGSNELSQAITEELLDDPEMYSPQFTPRVAADGSFAWSGYLCTCELHHRYPRHLEVSDDPDTDDIVVSVEDGENIEDRHSHTLAYVGAWDRS